MLIRLRRAKYLRITFIPDELFNNVSLSYRMNPQQQIVFINKTNYYETRRREGREIAQQLNDLFLAFFFISWNVCQLAFSLLPPSYCSAVGPTGAFFSNLNTTFFFVTFFKLNPSVQAKSAEIVIAGGKIEHL